MPSGDRRPPNQDRSRQAPRNLAYHLRKETSQRWPGKHSARAVKRAALQSARGRVAGSSRGAGWTPRGCAAGQSSAETCSPDATGRGRSSGTLRPCGRLPRPVSLATGMPQSVGGTPTAPRPWRRAVPRDPAAARKGPVAPAQHGAGSPPASPGLCPEDLPECVRRWPVRASLRRQA